MLEEHIREIELQSQERLIEEQKRHKELVQRLEVRPCSIIQSLSQFYPDFIQTKLGSLPGSLHIFVTSFFVKATKIPKIGCEIFISMCSFFAFC